MKNKLEKSLNNAIKVKIFPGCIVGVVRRNGERILALSGNFTYEKDSVPIREDSIFDVASITKSIPTSCLALELIDEGKLNLKDKLTDYVPEFNNPDREAVLVKHLLTHTLDFKSKGGHFRLSTLKDKSPNEILRIIFNADFNSKPGTKFVYVNATSILLGLVVERATGKRLDEFAQKIFFKPLKMVRTTYHPRRLNKNDIVPTEFDEWRGRLIQGEVHDESAYTLMKKQIVGSAGLFSTADDLLNFLEMLLNKGTLFGKRFFSQEMVKEMHTNQIQDIGGSAGLGWELNQKRYMGKSSTADTFGKTGFTGCIVVCDIPKDVGVVMLSNYTFPKRKSGPSLINKVRSEIMDLVFENI